MQRVTISLDDELADEFDALVGRQGYQSRSEAVRDLIRRAVDIERLSEASDEMCVANLSYVYDHHTRDLARVLTELQHERHDLVVSSTHVHLDHHSCLESTMMRGPVKDVRALGESIRTQRGVRFGAMNLVSLPSPEPFPAHDPSGHAPAAARPRRDQTG